MEQIGNAVLSLVTAAIIVGILGSLTHEKTGTGTLIRMICGLFLAFHIISPFTDLDYDIITAFAQEYSDGADLAAATGKEMAAEALCAGIKAESESYILDKAHEFGADLEVDVTVSREDVPVPESVRVRGTVSPHTKLRLQQMIEQDLGIPKEKQLWIG